MGNFKHLIEKRKGKPFTDKDFPLEKYVYAIMISILEVINADLLMGKS